jgi:hypothetical protein
MPYRTPAEMPEEEEPEMSDTLRIWKMILITGVSGLALILAYNVFSTLHADQTAILKAQIESTPTAAQAAQARYLEAKALSDRAMFEQMTKAAEKK